MSARVRVGSSCTTPFAVRNGLRQGCSIAPVLFNLYFSLVMEKWREQRAHVNPGSAVLFRYNINGNLFNQARSKYTLGSVADLEFADDAVLAVLSRQSAQAALSVFHSVAASFGLTVNFTKTKFMGCGNGLSEADLQPLVVAGHAVESVKCFTYLGTSVSPDARAGPEVDRQGKGCCLF